MRYKFGGGAEEKMSKRGLGPSINISTMPWNFKVLYNLAHNLILKVETHVPKIKQF